MGWHQHNAILITAFGNKDLIKIRKKAIELYSKEDRQNLISKIIHSRTNGLCTLFISPDGSKEGWYESNNINDHRTELMDWIDSQKDIYVTYIEVEYGGDYGAKKITRSNFEETY